MAQLTRVAGSIGLITLQNPPVNALSISVRKGITDTLKRALTDPKVKGVVICGSNGVFCGGADIREFGTKVGGPHLVPMINNIESADKPVVAAIQGSAVGGGLELALGCHYRIAHSKAMLGLPEVTLGLLPGAGGTQRLPRLIGVPAALRLITTGSHVTAAEALQLGIVDQVTDQNAVEVAVKFALSVTGKPLHGRRISSLSCPPTPNLDALLEGALQHVRQRARGAAAPVACVQAVRAATTLPYEEGMRREAELMATLFGSGQARALQYFFFAQRAVAKWSTPGGARWDTSRPAAVHSAAVVGLGTMGRGIVVALVRAGLTVVAIETYEKQLADAKREITGMLERGAARLKVAPPLAKVSYSSSLGAAAGVDLVVEAVFEDLAVKEEVFQQLSAVCKPTALLCSNTSTLDVDRLASRTRRPDLVVGMHFFAPAHVMRLLEVVVGPRSAPETVATAMQLGKRMGKVSVAVGNCHGFVGNRMLQPFLDQAHFLVEEGARPELVDEALVEFGYVMGPFRMSDLSGLDIGWRIRRAKGLLDSAGGPGLASRFRQGRRYCPLGDMLCEHGRLGQKAGKGWYQYEGPGGRTARPDPWVSAFLEGYRAEQGLVVRRVDSQEVLERCVYALINEGFRVLEEGMAAGPEDVDVIYVFGYSWPRHRGGPMFYASQVGLARVLERLEHYHRAHPDVPALEPSRLLRRLVASGSPPIQKWRELIQQVRSQL